jgi:putative N-acetylmannosamine-6-phosphate epimerase
MSFFEALQACPVVASVQASPGSPLEDPETLWRSAKASLDQGVRILRLQGVENIRYIRARHSGPIIGLLKVDYPDSEVYITPTLREVRSLLELGVEVVALDATDRPRPGGVALAELVQAIHEGGALAMADCDSIGGLAEAARAECDIFSTTMAGYTAESAATPGPDFNTLSLFAFVSPGPILAEGRFQEPWQARAALRMGAAGVVIGGALNDPVKQTRRFLAAGPAAERAGSVDLGGTWLRFAVVNSSLEIESLVRIPTPQDRASRLDWIASQARAARVDRVGISAGGTIDPATGEVWEAKDFIPDYRGTVFSLPGINTRALNDGLATAWGHSLQPGYAASRVAALALGTGVGAGLVDRGAILHGPRGEYPRWNDLPLAEGGTVEEALGGLSLTATPDAAQRKRAISAARQLVDAVRKVWMPDVIVVTGGVGLSPWMREALAGCGVEFGSEEAGLIGGGALALYPPG